MTTSTVNQSNSNHSNLANLRHTLSAPYFTSDRIFAAELSRIFSKNWVQVGRMEQIPNKGDYFLTNVAGESLIVLKNRNNDLAAFYNVCRHRGTKICSNENGQTGHFPGTISCPYHGWTYDLSGRLISARCMQDVGNFEMDSFPLHSVAVGEWEGFIFINLMENPPPLSNKFAPFGDRFSGYELPNLRLGRKIEYTVEANWKLVVQNYSECYHCPLVHPALERLSSSQSGVNDLVEGVLLGGYSALKDGVGSLTVSGKSVAKPFDKINSEDLDRIYYYLIFPNMLLSVHADYVMVHTLQPLSFSRTHIVCEFLFHPDALEQPGFKANEAADFWDMTNRQDWKVCELTQAGVSSRGYKNGVYAEHEEELLYAFDQEYLRALGPVSV